MEVVRQTESLLESLAEESAGSLRTGGIGVRDLRRLARAADVPEPAAAVLVEVAATAGLIGEADAGALAGGARAAGEIRFLTTLAYEQWVAASTANRWARLTRAWLVMNRQPGLIGRRTNATGPATPRRSTASDRDRPVSVLGPELERTGAPRLRAAVLGVLADLPPGATPSVAEVLEALHWRAPRRSPWQPGAGETAATEPVRWTLAEAAQLGLTGLGGLTDYGRMLLAEAVAAGTQDPDDDPLGLSRPDTAPASPAVGVLDALLPAPVDHMLIQADLTVVVPGPPEPDLAAELAIVAERESAGGASVYRVTPERIRYALDTGYSAGELQKLFAKRSRTGVPQSLTYLIDDTARRHGGLRLGAAGCYLRSEDAALLAEIAADARLDRPVAAGAGADRARVAVPRRPGHDRAPRCRFRAGAGGRGRCHRRRAPTRRSGPSRRRRARRCRRSWTAAARSRRLGSPPRSRRFVPVTRRLDPRRRAPVDGPHGRQWRDRRPGAHAGDGRAATGDPGQSEGLGGLRRRAWRDRVTAAATGLDRRRLSAGRGRAHGDAAHVRAAPHHGGGRRRLARALSGAGRVARSRVPRRGRTRPQTRPPLGATAPNACALAPLPGAEDGVRIDMRRHAERTSSSPCIR